MQRPLFVEIAGGLLLLFAWILVESRILDLPPLVGTAEVLFLGALFAWRYLLPSSDPAQIERRARSRARALGPQLPWAIASAVTVAVFLIGFVSIYARFVPPTPEPIDTLVEFLRQPYAMVPILLTDVVVDPMVQEVIFRGWIQGRLSTDFGPEMAIVSAAGIFAAVRPSTWEIPPLFLFGLASGYTVYLTRSVWSGVLMSAVFSLGSDLLQPPLVVGDPLAPITGGPDGVRNTIVLMLAAAIASILVWHRQRIVRDALAARDAGPPGDAAAD